MASSAAATVQAAHVKAVRSFNRFYTSRIGVLDPYLDSDFSLTEVRVLYELAHRDQPTASELGRDLRLDAGYLSRILRRFENQGWLARVPSPADARQSLLKLTKSGHDVFAPLQQKSRDEAAALLAPLAPGHRDKLISALGTVQELLDPPASTQRTVRQRTVVLRDPQPGDYGWVVEQHGALYAKEWGYTAHFEALGEIRQAGFGLMEAFGQVWKTGNKEQRDKALTVINEARKKLYLILADED